MTDDHRAMLTTNIFCFVHRELIDYTGHDIRFLVQVHIAANVKEGILAQTYQSDETYRFAVDWCWYLSALVPAYMAAWYLMHTLVKMVEHQFFTSRQVLYFVIGIRVRSPQPTVSQNCLLGIQSLLWELTQSSFASCPNLGNISRPRSVRLLCAILPLCSQTGMERLIRAGIMLSVYAALFGWEKWTLHSTRKAHIVILRILGCQACDTRPPSSDCAP